MNTMWRSHVSARDPSVAPTSVSREPQNAERGRFLNQERRLQPKSPSRKIACLNYLCVCISTRYKRVKVILLRKNLDSICSNNTIPLTVLFNTFLFVSVALFLFAIRKTKPQVWCLPRSLLQYELRSEGTKS